MIETSGARFRSEVQRSPPLPVAGVINAYSALLAARAGFRAIYLSGAGVANASFGLPDLAMTGRNDVLEEVRRITGVSTLPLLVDADTGWGGFFGIARTVRELERAGAAGMHIEDQTEAKRCGHRPNKSVVPTDRMCDRIKAAVDGRGNREFVVMARTDAFAREGLNATIERCLAYLEAGADMIFPEAAGSLEDYHRFVTTLQVPILANLTEFGMTPALTRVELATVGVAIALYPLSAFRAMSRAAERVYGAILNDGTQAGVLDIMQTRAELYDVLGYDTYERRLDDVAGGEDHE